MCKCFSSFYPLIFHFSSFIFLNLSCLFFYDNLFFHNKTKFTIMKPLCKKKKKKKNDRSQYIWHVLLKKSVCNFSYPSFLTLKKSWGRMCPGTEYWKGDTLEPKNKIFFLFFKRRPNFSNMRNSWLLWFLMKALLDYRTHKYLSIWSLLPFHEKIYWHTTN